MLNSSQVKDQKLMLVREGTVPHKGDILAKFK